MDDTGILSTLDALRKLCFTPFADPMPVLSYNFGNFRLSAQELINDSFQQVVKCSGVLSTPRTLSEVDFDMPLEVASVNLCAAWIVWHLDKAADGKHFIPTRPAEWLEEGRANFMLLPWVARQAAYEARPRCQIRRDWARLALRTLAESLACLTDDAPVVFNFLDGILQIRVGLEPLTVMATGESWPHPFLIPAGRLRSLPKRLMGDPIEISVRGRNLQIDRHFYAGVEVYPP